MPINDFRVQLATAYPGLERLESGKGRTLRGRIAIDKGTKIAYIKLLDIEGIAKEALCAVLARMLHLPMLQPYYVNVDPSYLHGIAAGNPFNVGFGLEEDSTPAPRVTSQTLTEEILLWPEALRVAAFDEWICNRDRIPDNLLFAGNRHFWLIDHDDALPSYASPGTNSSS